jgi:hypothetical protein
MRIVEDERRTRSADRDARGMSDGIRIPPERFAREIQIQIPPRDSARVAEGRRARRGLLARVAPTTRDAVGRARSGLTTRARSAYASLE